MKFADFFIENITWFIAGIVLIMAIISIVLITKIVKLKKEEKANKNSSQQNEQDEFSQLLANNIWEGSETAHQTTEESKNDKKQIKEAKKKEKQEKKKNKNKEELHLGDKGFRPKMIFVDDNTDDNNTHQSSQINNITQQQNFSNQSQTRDSSQPDVQHVFVPNKEPVNPNQLKLKLSKNSLNMYRFKIEENNITQLLSILYSTADEAKRYMQQTIDYIKTNDFDIDTLDNGARFSIKINNKIVAVSNTYPNVDTAHQESIRIKNLIIKNF